MEDEEEIQSYQNGRPRSPSPSSSQPVTVAAAPPQHTLTLALPIQQPKPTGAGGGVAGTGGGGGSGGGGGREDCWSEGATSVLIDAWGERYLELSRGNLKQKHWKEVAEIVSGREDYTKPSKTDVQCKNRIDTLKKKYKQEKGKIASGQGPSKWPFFHRLDHLIGPNSKIATAATPPNPTTAAAAVASGNALATPMLLPGAKVPTAIPVGHRSLQKQQPQQPQQPQRMNLLKHQQLQHQQQQQQQQRQQQQFRRSTESNSSRSGAAMGTPGSSDSFPPEPVNRKRGRIGKESRRRMRMKGNNNINNNWGNSIRELTSAILEFGEAYERAETSKLQEIVEMEKQRMGFAKELELQRMQFFMKTQLELTQLKQQQGKRGGGGGGGGGNGHQNHHHQHGNNNRNNNSSD